MGRLRSRTRKWIIVVALAVLILLIAGGTIASVTGARHYFVLSPGSAPSITASPLCKTTGGGNLRLPSGKPCVRLEVPASQVHVIDGSLFMVDVLEGRATPGQYALSKLGLLHVFDEGATLIPAGAVLGSTPASQLNCQSDQAMTSATSSASVVALRRLGYMVVENDMGAQVDQVQPGSPAAAAGIMCNDLVIAANGVAIHTDAELVNEIHSLKPGDVLPLTLSRTGSGGKTTVVHVTAHLTGTPAEGGQPAQPTKAFLGVAVETRTTFTFPFNVTIDVGEIGGPSAGLALTLGLLDVLSSGKLTGGHAVAATGTMSLNGEVGPIGGAAQKAVAVRRAGAKVFLVPPANLQAAESEAGSMKVYAVSSIEQALSVLESMGGQIPPPTGGSGTATSTTQPRPRS
jgi:PDZ domain-containing protein